jgi:hypothetical protein
MNATPHPSPRLTRPLMWALLMLLSITSSLWAPKASAQTDPPGRVGRIVQMQGGGNATGYSTGQGSVPATVALWRYEEDEARWVPAERNRPFTSGDRLLTATEARAELRVGSTVLRLAGGTELEVLRLDDERLVFQLHAGSLALRVRSVETASEIEIVTHEARARPQRAGHYRFDKFERSAAGAEASIASAWVGDLVVETGLMTTIGTGERLVLRREGGGERWRDVPAPLSIQRGPTESDLFATWALNEDQRDEVFATAPSNGYGAQPLMASEMTGAEDLYRYGAWQTHPEHGTVWMPNDVPQGWAPYRHGHWQWLRPWGWTWVDDAAWGFAPFHYGRWLMWQGRWAWWPGAVHARPVYSPAVVGWVGGSGGVSITVRGAPAVGWVPLAPREAWVPHYATSTRYQQRLNLALPLPPLPMPPGVRQLINQVIPGAVTLVLRDVMVRHEPVHRAVVDPRYTPRDRSHGHYTPPPAPEVRRYVPPVGGAPVVAPRADRPYEGRGDARNDPRRDARPEPRAAEPRGDSRGDTRGDARSDPRADPRGDARADPRNDPRGGAGRSGSNPPAANGGTPPARSSEPLVIMPAQVVPSRAPAPTANQTPGPVAQPPAPRPTYSDSPPATGPDRARDWRFEPNPRRGEGETAGQPNGQRGRQPPPSATPSTPTVQAPPKPVVQSTVKTPPPAATRDSTSSPKQPAPPPVEGRGDAGERKRGAAAAEGEGKR